MENISRLNHFYQFDYKLKIKLFLKLTALILGVNLFYILTFVIIYSDNTSAFFIYNPFFSPFIPLPISFMTLGNLPAPKSTKTITRINNNSPIPIDIIFFK